MKRFISFLMAFVMALCLFTLTANAHEHVTGCLEESKLLVDSQVYSSDRAEECPYYGVSCWGRLLLFTRRYCYPSQNMDDLTTGFRCSDCNFEYEYEVEFVPCIH